MAEAGELIVFNPPYTEAEPLQQQEAAERATAKRVRDGGSGNLTPGEAEGEEVRSPKRRKVQDVLFRIVVPSRQIGKVIGRVGSRIQRIREETRATIKIADAVARHEERVIIISSKDNDEVITDAENALHLIAGLILKDDDGNSEAAKVGQGHVAANAVRLIIAGTQAGSLIGVSGQNIEKLRNSSGATITVLAQNQLPLCASANESDRVVQVSGDVPAVLKAVVEIACQLRENPARQVFSISPNYNHSINRAAQHYLDPTSADYVTFDMVISEAMVGGLIGRCGSNISRIRAESGATIKVHGGKGEQNLRQVRFGGSAQQVALAKQRVDEYIYSQLLLQAGPQQAMSYQVGPAANLASMYSAGAPPLMPGHPLNHAHPVNHPGLPVHAHPQAYYDCRPYC